MSSPAFIPYCGSPPVPGALVWNTDPVLITVLIGVGATYAIGCRRAGAPSRTEQGLFAAGFVIAAAALISPLCNLSVALFSARVMQHIVLTLVAAPLIVLGRPALVFGRWLPPHKSRPGISHAVSISGTAFAAAMWTWHLPGPYDATLENNAIYWAMHITTFGSALLLWHELLLRHTAQPGAALLVGFGTAMQMSFLGAILTLAPHAMFHVHFATTWPWDLSPLQDQELGGLIMWVPGGLLFTAYGLATFGSLLNGAGESAQRARSAQRPGRRTMHQSPKEDLAAAVGVAPPDIEISRDTARASAPIPTSSDELGALDADRCSGGDFRHGGPQGPVRSAVRARSPAFAHHGDRRRSPAAAERRPYSSQLCLATARAAGWTRRTVVVARTRDEASKIATAARLDAMSLIVEDAPVDRSGAGPTRRGRLAAKLADRVTLLKPRVMSLAVFTAMVGLLIAPVPIHPLAAVGAVLCIAAGAGAAGALNMWYDADIDAVMSRTAARPIPAGRVSPGAALRFGLTLAVLSVAALAGIANWLAAALLALAIGFYVIVYTIWLKRTTSQNIVIGGAAGACPPLIGWAAATNSIGIEPLILALVIFFWTPPHFWALSLRRADEYARAGVPMLPVVAGAEKTRQQILIYSLILAPFGSLPWLLGDAGPLYGIVSIAGGAALAALSLRLRGDIGDKAAMQLFGFSILYLFVLFTVLLLDVKLGPVVARLL